MSLFTDLRAFAWEHEYCGELDGGVEGDIVWMTCTCGAMIVPPTPPSNSEPFRQK
jgi:hypothetical protein